MDFIKLDKDDSEGIREMSKMATTIVKEHFDPVIGSAQNDYMIERFQTVDAISEQLNHGYRYYFARENGENIGFAAFFPRNDAMYLSKFYLYKEARGKGYSRDMLSFIADEARKEGLKSIELNVNRHNSACKAYDSLGFKIIRTEKNDIGCGFVMDDYVYSYEL